MTSFTKNNVCDHANVKSVKNYASRIKLTGRTSVRQADTNFKII